MSEPVPNPDIRKPATKPTLTNTEKMIMDYSIELMPKDDDCGAFGIILKSSAVPRKGEIITVNKDGKELKFYVYQIAYEFSDKGMNRGTTLKVVKALVGSEPPRN